MINRVLLYNSGGGIGDSIQLLPLIETLKSVLKNVDFYTEFVSKLRTSYLEDLQEFATIGFRKNNILYSFEDIISSTGIEDADVSNSSLYYDYLTKEQQELSKTLNTQSYPRYIKNISFVLRSITGLLQDYYKTIIYNYIIIG